MVRTQIQLTEAQSDALRVAARRAGSSVAKITGEAVDHWLLITGEATLEERRRAGADVPSFPTCLSDLAERHDHYLSEESA